jgi:hypothetical protein
VFSFCANICVPEKCVLGSSIYQIIVTSYGGFSSALVIYISARKNVI